MPCDRINELRQHPQRGLLWPADFLAVAEGAGLLPKLGWWVLERCVAELESWRELDGMAARLDELATLAPGVRAAAEAARAGTLDDSAAATVTGALERLEAALRARTAAGARGPLRRAFYNGAPMRRATSR